MGSVFKNYNNAPSGQNQQGTNRQAHPNVFVYPWVANKVVSPPAGNAGTAKLTTPVERGNTFVYHNHNVPTAASKARGVNVQLGSCTQCGGAQVMGGKK
jgi:hypothetical protein